MSVVKSGYLRKHSKSIISGGWNRVWVILHQDTNLVVYKKQGDTSAMGTINMFEVKKWFAYGDYTSGMPDRPDPPKGETFSKMIGIPQKPSKKAKVHWFLADTEADMHSWMDAICKVLPPPPQKEAPVQQQQAQPVSSAPPPYPGGPGPSLGFDGMAAGPSMPQASAVPQPAYAPQPGYPQQPAYHPQQQPAYHPQQQPAYPQQGAYPQQAYYRPPPPQQAAYPQQQYYPGPAPVPGYAPPPGAYPQQPYYAQGGYYQHPPQTVVIHQTPQKQGFMSGNTGNMAMGVLGGAALGYGMSRMMGGGMMGGGMMGWGMGGSWSSLSSFGSFSSCGSFGSF